MSSNDNHPRSRAYKWRRRFLWVVLVGVVVSGAWYGIEHFVLDIDRYRSGLIEEIEASTGLPTQIHKLDLALLPTPHVNIFDVTVGTGDFAASAARVSLEVEILPLLDRILHITQIDLAGLTLRVPDSVDELSDRIDTLIDRLNEPVEDALFADSRVDRIDTSGGRIFRGESTGLFAKVTASGHDILSSEIRVSIDAALDEYGANAELSADTTFALDDKGGLNSVSGDAAFDAIDLTAFWDDAPRDALVAGALSLTGDSWQRIRLETKGTLESPEETALNGIFSGDLWFEGDQTTVNDIRWDGNGAAIGADLTSYGDGRIALQAKEAHFVGPGLAYLIEILGLNADVIVSGPTSTFDARGLLVAWDSNGAARIVDGEGDVKGLDFIAREEDYWARGASARFAATDDLIRLESFDAQGLHLEGAIKPDFESDVYEVNFTGTADVKEFRTDGIVPSDILQNLEGQIEITRLAGTFTGDGNLPSDFQLEGQIARGAFVFEAGSTSSEIQSIAGAFTGTHNLLSVELAGSSPSLGALDLSGAYSYEDSEWKGRLSGNVPTVVNAFIESETTRESLAELLELFGDATLSHTFRSSDSESSDAVLTWNHEGGPSLEGTLTFASAGEEVELARIDADALLPLDGLARTFPRGIRASGDCPIRLRADIDDGVFRLEADFSSSSIRAGEGFTKRSGDSFGLTLEGRATNEEWSPESLTIDCLDATIPFAIDEGRVYTDRLDIELTSLNGLMADGGSLSGNATGRLAFAPFEIDVQLRDAGLSIDTDHAIDSMNGFIRYDEDGFSCRDLLVVSQGSQALITAEHEDGGLKGLITGPAIHADKLIDLYDAIAVALHGEVEEPSEEPDEIESPNQPVKAQFAVSFDEVFYGRGLLDFFQANVVYDDTGLHIRDISCRPYSGSITGTVEVGLPEKGERPLAIDLTFDTIDMRIFDDCLLAEPRHLQGIMSGKLNLMSFVGDYKRVLNRGSGSASWIAQNGNFGKLGWATKLLAVLNTTNVLRLRLPSLRDEGLKFETCSGTLLMSEGKMGLEQAVLSSPSYSMEAGGQVDFAQNETDVIVLVQPLETINRLVRKIPIVGDAVEMTTKLANIRVRFTGSPYESSADLEEGK